MRALLTCCWSLLLLTGTPLLHAQSSGHKPDLYLLTIAVGDYQDPKIPDLRFPDSDARAMRSWAEAQQGRLYDQTHVAELTNAKATRAAIIQKMVEFFRPALPNDQLILYLAGHGLVIDERQSWHFLPSDTQLGALEATALEQDDILKKLENPSRPHKRVLVLTDTCQAGALADALGGGNSSLSGGVSPTRGGRGLKLKTDITLAPDVVEAKSSLWLVFGAGTAADQAEEGEQYKLPTDPDGIKGHGVFTWAILQALASNQADSDKSGTITLSEFVQYVSRVVARATNNRQLPVMSGRFMEVAIGYAPGSVEICDGKDNNLDGAIDEGFDKDGNKVGDCLQTETCNGKDDNNNGLIDEGFDADGDGYPSRERCGSVIGTDCNDKDLTIHPNQEDWGNLRDDDCDGLTDEDDFDRNSNGQPDTPERRLGFATAVQLGGLGLGLGLMGGTVWAYQSLLSLEQPPTGDNPNVYLSSPAEAGQYTQLQTLRNALGSAGTLSLGLSLGFTFYGHELKARLPHPWKSPKAVDPEPTSPSTNPAPVAAPPTRQDPEASPAGVGTVTTPAVPASEAATASAPASAAPAPDGSATASAPVPSAPATPGEAASGSQAPALPAPGASSPNP